MPSTFISASRIVSANVSAPNPPKQYELKPPKVGKYSRTYLQYNYGTPQQPSISEPLFELAITNGTIRKKVKDGKTEWKLNLRISNKQDLAGLEQLDAGMRQVIFKYKGKFNLHSYNPDNDPSFRGSFFSPRDDNGELIQGADPIMSLKINDQSSFQAVIDSKGNTEKVDYHNLEDKTITCSVIFNPRDLYSSGSAPSPQLFVRSCMIMSVSDKGEVDHNKSDIVRKFLQENPSMIDTLIEQIAKLKAGEKTSLLETATNSNNKTPPPPVQMPVNQPLQVPAVNQPYAQPSIPNLSYQQYSGQIDLTNLNQGGQPITLTKL